MKALLGQKVGMTQILQDDGTAVPVTLIKAGPCTVTQIKELGSDGYNAVQIAYGNGKNVAKPQAGHFNKAKVAPAISKEIRGIEFDEEATKVGSSFDVNVFEIGDKVDVQGTTKGKGWAGTIKRWNFERSRKTHGGKGNSRRPGSIGSMYPQKIFKGKRMAGQMGHVTATMKNLEVMYVDADTQIIGVKGSIPGPRKSYVRIKGVA